MDRKLLPEQQIIFLGLYLYQHGPTKVKNMLIQHFTEIIDYNIALREELEKIILIKMKALVLRFKDLYDYHYQYIMKKDKDLSIINKEIINDSFPNDVQFKLNYNKCIIKNDKHHIPIKLLKKKDFLKSKKSNIKLEQKL